MWRRGKPCGPFPDSADQCALGMMNPRTPELPNRRTPSRSSEPMQSSLLPMLFPATPRRLPYEREVNIVLRTAHLMTSGILLGGHVFDVSAHRLILFLYLTIASGISLILLELFSSCRWIYLAKGVIVMVKVALVIAVGIWWDHRVFFLLLVVVIGSIGSHMPARFRYFSFLHQRVIVDPPKAASGAPLSTWRQ